MILRQLPLIWVASVANNLSAAEWTIDSGISTGLTYTDNVDLDNTGQKSDLIATLTPNISLSGKGARANVELAASVQFKDLSGASDSRNTQLQANADIELVENLLFFESNATVTQNVLDPNSASGSDNLNNTGNTAATRSIRLSPYVAGRLKRFATYEARYTYDEVSASDTAYGGSSSDHVLLALNSGQKFGKFSWGVRGDYRSTETEQSSSSENKTLNLSLGYQVNRKWQVNGNLGKEWNDADSIQRDANGFTWDLGAVWTPSVRTNLDFGLGERYFGSTKRLSFSHVNKRVTWVASYTQSLTDAHTLLTEQDVLSEYGPAARAVNYILGTQLSTAYLIEQGLRPNLTFAGPQTVAGIMAAVNTSAFVDQRFSTSFIWKGRRTTLTVNGDHSTQTYEDSSLETEVLGLGLTLTRRLSGLITADANINWNETESIGTQNTSSETLRLGAGISQQLGQHTDLRLNYSYSERDSNQASQGYEENRLALTLMHNF